ncbi:Leucyl aminopeptidase yscIV [Coemansia sp. RSA 1813]|nr:Leucyl aminopeptidase yscIV [Coemansia sp. RSA 1646]KAJ1771230.1 Leucyl aminopeptidase yscIV [Coemansia sp. RSA 1843]KAJ2092799.1 Leucyl aminopeptidase yscIV [Coemansia sp. RSA 986]KAJ2217701.1 Leucyl aminopeptidase yscIV [Coemansia sp. RSA 487]KAJ2573061.1 Leucyl aminopeptidase yscIV [Coemansia sp. RSA 1813]
MQVSKIDVNSYANLEETTTDHVHLDLTVDFNASNLSGSALISGRVLKDNVDAVVFDTNHLDIKHVWTKRGTEFVQVESKISDPHAVFGSALSVPFANARSGDHFAIRIEYTTTKAGCAIQFLSPEQTLGKKHPYLFTQCQPIYARSLFPCQDSPSVKISYSASIRVPKPLTALMSAIATSSSESDSGDFTVFNFEQKTTIPSYLVALVVGNLATAKISDRCAVWSEPETIDACAWEFAEMEKTLQTAEELITPYQWGRYDLLVLPPSFPYGGMENPCLTFVTPTLLASDRSLTDVIAHEIAHSWSGNLVTAKNWEHFWLNEGWTTYFERKIVSRLSGEDARQLSLALGYRSLKNDVELYGKDSPLTALVPNLDGIDPDDAYSRIPYEKGSLLIYYLEQLFDPVIWSHISKMYIRKFEGQSIGTGDFYDFLKKYVEHYLDRDAEKKLESVNWDAWFKGPGMPPVEFKFDEKPQHVATELADRWWANRESAYSLDEFPPQQFSALLTQQKVIFLNSLKDKGDAPHAMLGFLDRIYGLSSSHNCEVRFSWLMLALANHYEDVFDSTVAMLSEQGRMKYTRPLYRAMAASGEKGNSLAIKTFSSCRSSYHPICARMVAGDFGI